ncbi:hypothetical protein B0H13DRAFT_1858151 [Mycena leptocephala]|nr:hypothetical protein B0H13DRAFT_1858151 [Mycena leptocephala]
MSGVEASGVAASILQLVDMSISKSGRRTGTVRTPLQIQNLKAVIELLNTALEALSLDLEAIKASLRARLRFVWSDQKLKTLLDEVRWQSNALHLLLSALNLPGPQQNNKMKTVAQSVSIRYRMDEQRRVPGSILSDQEFDNEVKSRAYRDALARVAARQKRAPVEAPEYTIVGVLPLNCLTQDIVDDVFLKDYDGLDKRLKTLAPGASSLGSRFAHALPVRPNLSWESRWRFYIYCAPCRWHLDLSLSVCAHVVGFNGYVRVDDRLRPSCYGGGSQSQSAAPRMKTLEKTLEDIEDKRRNHKVYIRSSFSKFDLPWLQRQNIMRAKYGDADEPEEDATRTSRLDDYIAQVEAARRARGLHVHTGHRDPAGLGGGDEPDDSSGEGHLSA